MQNDDKALAEQLKASAQSLPTYQPDDSAWQAIHRQLPQQKHDKLNKLVASMTAFICITILWLSNGPYKAADEISGLISRSQQLEQQVEQHIAAARVREDIRWQLYNLDKKIQQTTDSHIKKQLWQKRIELLTITHYQLKQPITYI